MTRFFTFVILLVGIASTTSSNLHNNETQHEEVTVTTVQDFAPNHLTVENKTETSKTMTDTLGQDGELSQGRTFAIRKLQFILLPLMYVFGVMSTLIVLIFGISLKILLIGTILLFIKVSSFLAKFHHHEVPHHDIPWSPPPPQPLHVHLHHDEIHDPHDDVHHTHEDVHHHHDDVHHHDDDHNDHHDKHIQEQVFSGWEYPPPASPYDKAVAMEKVSQYMYKG